ncbi:MAG: hypothetical protein ACR2HF_12295 [Methylococcaceae bacterium]
MALPDDPHIHQLRDVIVELLKQRDSDADLSAMETLQAHEIRFWKILDLFNELPAPSRLRLLYAGLELSELVERASPIEDCTPNDCNVLHCGNVECSSMMQIEVKNRLSLIHMREWFFKYSVVVITLVFASIVGMVATGVDLPDGMVKEILGDIVELAKLMFAS